MIAEKSSRPFISSTYGGPSHTACLIVPQAASAPLAAESADLTMASFSPQNYSGNKLLLRRPAYEGAKDWGRVSSDTLTVLLGGYT